MSQLTGKAGTITIHNCRCAHGSEPNISPTSRHLLLQTFTPASAEAIPTGSNVGIMKSKRGDGLVRGEAQAAVWDERARPETQECNWMPVPGSVPMAHFFKSKAGGTNKIPVVQN